MHQCSTRSPGAPSPSMETPCARDSRAHRPPNGATIWPTLAGFLLLTATILFLMALVVAGVLGHPVPCSTRGLVVFVIALTTGAAAGFLTGSAKAEGKLPFFGDNVISIAASGAIAAIIIVLTVGFRLYVSTPECLVQQSVTVPEATETEKQIARTFWDRAYAHDWAAAYQMFPSAIRDKSPLSEFIDLSSSYLS